MNTTNVFHKISYLQYPSYLIALYYYTLFIISFTSENARWDELNNVFIFVGIGISLSTLQDTTKTQNKFSERIWKNPKKGKSVLLLIGLMTLTFLVGGLIGFLNSEENFHKEISFGMIVTGIGLISMLKAAKEMFENHRTDKNVLVKKSEPLKK